MLESDVLTPQQIACHSRPMKLSAKKNAITMNMEIISILIMIAILKYTHTKCNQYHLPLNKNNV